METLLPITQMTMPLLNNPAFINTHMAHVQLPDGKQEQVKRDCLKYWRVWLTFKRLEYWCGSDMLQEQPNKNENAERKNIFAKYLFKWTKTWPIKAFTLTFHMVCFDFREVNENLMALLAYFHLPHAHPAHIGNLPMWRWRECKQEGRNFEGMQTLEGSLILSIILCFLTNMK